MPEECGGCVLRRYIANLSLEACNTTWTVTSEYQFCNHQEAASEIKAYICRFDAALNRRAVIVQSSDIV